MIFKNKKGIAFFGLISIFMILAYLIFMVTYKSPSDDAILEIQKVNSQLKLVDKIKQQKIIDDFYKSEELLKIKTRVISSFSNLNYLTNDQKIKRSDLGCRISNLNIWYDQRKINKKEIDGSNLCFLDISKKDISNNLNNLINTESKNSFDIGFKNNVDINFDKTKKKYNLNIKTEESKNSKVGEVIDSSSLGASIDLNSFSNLILTLNSIIPKISKSNRQAIPKCLKENLNNEIDNKELYCIEKNFINLIKLKNPNLLLNYDFKINYIKDISIEDFFSLEVNVLNKKTKSKILDFALILNYNIPQNLVSFSISNYNLADNILKIKINKPKINSDKIKGYIILYSYENFFSPSFSGFNPLKEILNSGKVPKDISGISLTKKNNIDGLNLDVEYHIFKNPNLKLNLISVGPKNFNENLKTNIFEKSIYLYQIYNYDTKKFDKLDLNKEIYSYVFAYDKNYNYYVDAIEESLIKKIKPKSNFGPMPLLFDSLSDNFGGISISGGLENLEKTIKIQIPKDFYKFDNFDHYDIYLMDGLSDRRFKNENIGCQNFDFPCNYFSGNDFNLKNPNLDLILTSSNLDFKSFEKTQIIRPNFELKNGKSYDIFIVPIDKLGKGILTNTFIKYKIKPDGIADFYSIGNGDGLVVPKIFKNILVEDKLAPNPITSFKLLPDPIKIVGNNLVLQWMPISTDINYLSGTLTKIDISSGNILSSSNVNFDLNNIIAMPKGGVRIEISNLIPVDNFGNSFDSKTSQTKPMISFQN